jgi:hypothetical protein
MNGLSGNWQAMSKTDQLKLIVFRHTSLHKKFCTRRFYVRLRFAGNDCRNSGSRVCRARFVKPRNSGRASPTRAHRTSVPNFSEISRRSLSPTFSSSCVMSKTGHPNWLSSLHNYTADEGRPLEPACTELDSNTYRCCALRDVMVSGVGKGPEAKFGETLGTEGPGKLAELLFFLSCNPPFDRFAFASVE